VKRIDVGEAVIGGGVIVSSTDTESVVEAPLGANWIVPRYRPGTSFAVAALTVSFPPAETTGGVTLSHPELFAVATTNIAPPVPVTVSIWSGGVRPPCEVNDNEAGENVTADFAGVEHHSRAASKTCSGRIDASGITDAGTNVQRYR
jgi:hypothetical protein